MSDQPNLCASPPPAPTSLGNMEAVGNPFTYWDVGSTLHIHFLRGEPAWKREVARIASEWTQYANLDFRFYYDSANPPVDEHGNSIADIVIDHWDDGGGWSYYGTDSRWYAREGQASMMLPSWGEVGTILHEFGHALGLVHEHKSPAAQINWNREQVYRDAKAWWGWDRDKVDHNIFHQASRDSTQYTHYDDKSIMLYRIYAGWTTDGYETEYTWQLSETDKKFIAQVYPMTAGIRPNEVIGRGGWYGDIAVDGDYVYLSFNDNLYRGRIADNVVTQKVGTGGWNGSISADNGYIYLADVNGNLRRGKLGGNNIITHKIGTGGWHGAIDVDGDYIYLADGKLRRGRLGNNVVLNETLATEGWYWPFAVESGYIYETRFSNLQRGKIGKNPAMETLGRGGWNGTIDVDENSIYLVNGDLMRAILPED